MGQVPGGPGGTGAGAVGRQRGTGHCSPHPGRPRAFPQEPVLVHPSFLGSEVREGLCDGTDGAHGVKALSPMQGHGTESASVTGDRESGHSLGRPPLQPRDWCQPCPSQLPPGGTGRRRHGRGGGQDRGPEARANQPSLQVSLFPEAELRGFNPKPRGGQHVCLCTKQLTRGDSRAPSEPTSWGQNCTLKSRAGLEPPTFPAALGAGGQRQSQILLQAPGLRTRDGPRTVPGWWRISTGPQRASDTSICHHLQVPGASEKQFTAAGGESKPPILQMRKPGDPPTHTHPIHAHSPYFFFNDSKTINNSNLFPFPTPLALGPLQTT